MASDSNKEPRRALRRIGIKAVYAPSMLGVVDYSVVKSEEDEASPSNRPAEVVELTGFWALLPDELMEMILGYCGEKQLGMLQSSCMFFLTSDFTEQLARRRLKSIPRANSLRPIRSLQETYLKLLNFVNCQSVAAAQSTTVACGAYHTAALLTLAAPASAKPSAAATPTTTPADIAAAHSLCTFGRGFHGQLGNGAFADQNRPATVSLGFRPVLPVPCRLREILWDFEEETMAAVVACSKSHTICISRRGELFSWGLGFSGETGLGRWTPLEASTPRLVPLPPPVRIVSVAAGSHHTLAITEEGHLFSFGRGDHGQLGLGTRNHCHTARLITALTDHRIVSAAAGEHHSLALASDGHLFSWGDGRYGQLGMSSMEELVAGPNVGVNQAMLVLSPFKVNSLDPKVVKPDERVTALSAGADHTLVITIGGGLLAFGRNDHGQLGVGDCSANRFRPCEVPLQRPEDEAAGRPRVRRVVQAACGASHSLLLVCSNGLSEVWSSGCNTWGQLGSGDRKPRSSFAPLVHRIPGAIAIQAGDEHSVAVTSQGQLYVWGRGDCGQLGLGNDRSKWRPTLLPNAAVVHPDRTLRRMHRTGPRTRLVMADARREHHADQWHFQ